MMTSSQTAKIIKDNEVNKSAQLTPAPHQKPRPHIVVRKINPTLQAQLEKQGLSPLMSRVLAGRGVAHSADVEPLLENMLPPDTLKGLEGAVTLIDDALQHHKNIVVVGDYDCDGATATALAVSVLRRLGGLVNYVVPNREKMGYGLSPAVVALALQYRPHLIITVDNGIASFDGVALAQKHGVKVLITDHHLPADILPTADAIVNPNQPGCPFPSKHLAGVGVMFYVLIGLRRALEKRGISHFSLGDCLDLVALGTVADLVRLDANNRILVHYGLKRIREGKARAGLRALFKVAGRKHGQVSCGDLGFHIGPRLNAAGRIADMTIGIECLLAQDEDRAEALALQLNSINRSRKEVEAQVRDEAMAILEDINWDEVEAKGQPCDDINGEANARIKQKRTVTLFRADWHMGVIGIVASRVREATGLPTFIFTQDETLCLRGSGRSVTGIHLRDCLDFIAKKHPTLFKSFGGHAMAAGATINVVDKAVMELLHKDINVEQSHPAITAINIFQTAFNEAVQHFCPDIKPDVIETDGPLFPADFTLHIAKKIDSMVWGQGFPSPLFYDTFKITRWHNIKDNHWKLQVHNDKIKATALYFNAPEGFAPNLEPVDHAFTFSMMPSEYQGVVELNIRVEQWDI